MKNMYKTLLDHSTEGIILFDQKGDIVDVNASSIEMFGHSHNAFRNLHMNALLGPGKNFIEDLCLAGEVYNSSYILNKSLLKKDGSSVQVEISAKKIAGNIFVAFIKDVSQGKKYQQSLNYNSFIIESLTEAVITTDTSYNIDIWNQGAESLYGWKESEVRGKNIFTVLKMDFFKQDELITLYNALHLQTEVTHYTKYSAKKHVMLRASRVRNAQGEHIGFIWLNTDMTEKMLYEKKLEENKKILQDIAWVQCHDVRAPLANIMGLVNLIDIEGNSKDLNKKLLDHLKTSAQKLDKVVRHIVHSTAYLPPTSNKQQ